MHGSGRAISQALVRAVIVIEVEIAPQALLQCRHGRILFQINVFIFDAAPQAFIENVIKGSARMPLGRVHTDLNACYFECTGKGMRRKLDALVGVEDLGFPAEQCLL